MSSEIDKHPLEGATFQYASIARFKHSQQLDWDPQIRTLIEANRKRYETMADDIHKQMTEMGAPDSPELALCIHLLEQAKDAHGRALVHAIGKVNGVPFEKAVAASLKK